jgi:hypothetical protein
MNMARRKSSLLNELSTADLKRLLAARERIDVLEGEKSKLEKALAKVDKELGKLMQGTSGTGSGAVKRVRRKKAAKKTPKKTPKKAAKKPVRKKPVAKKTGSKKITRKKAATKKTAAGKMKLEDVIVSVIKKNRSSIAFQELKARITKGKLFKTKSGNFDNVLRRTLSTSKKVKRVGRGIYDLA